MENHLMNHIIASLQPNRFIFGERHKDFQLVPIKTEDNGNNYTRHLKLTHFKVISHFSFLLLREHATNGGHIA